MLHINSKMLSVFVVLVFNAYSALGWDIAAIPMAVPADITKEISFHFYGGSTIYDYTKISYDDGLSILDQSGYDRGLKTVFYLHGWSERPSDQDQGYSPDTIAEAFLKTKSVNLIAVNYENLVQHTYNITSWMPDIINMGAGYVTAVQNAKYIGTALGKFFEKFVDSCGCGDNLHIIGFSLGAQIMSYAASEYGPGKLRRLTALEAAGPIFSIPGYNHLGAGDGVFLDTIHTDAGGMGYYKSFGTCDFYPNLGRSLQPHCQSSTVAKCSHYTSVDYYAESIVDSQAFSSRQCSDPGSWTAGMCNNNGVAFMGYGVDTSTTGDYYLTTNADSPYGMRDAGLSAV